MQINNMFYHGKIGLILAITIFFMPLPASSKDITPKNCPVIPENLPKEIICLKGRAEEGIVNYTLLYGKSKVELTNFTRSVKIIFSSLDFRFAINNYEGSNKTDCYIFWNANKQKKLSAEILWRKIVSKNSRLNYLVNKSDHVYYTCERWIKNTLVLNIRVEDSNGSYRVYQGNLTKYDEITNVKELT